MWHKTFLTERFELNMIGATHEMSRWDIAAGLQGLRDYTSRFSQSSLQANTAMYYERKIG